MFLRFGPRTRPVILSRGGCFSEMGPEHIPLSFVGQVVPTIVVFSKYGPRTRPAILSRGGCSCKRQVLGFFKMGPEHVQLLFFSKWAPNTSHYPVSGRLIFTIVVFLRYGPRTRPAILSRGGCSCKRQVLCFFEMGPEHVPLSCVGQAILSRAGPCYPVSGRLFLQLLCF